MAPCVWQLPVTGYDVALDALADRGIRVESVTGPGDRSEQRFNARRGWATQRFVIRSGGELEAVYWLTWPWLWLAEGSLFGDVCRAFDGCCERLV